MLCYFLTRVGKRLKAAAESVRDRVIDFFRQSDPVTQIKCQARMNSFASGIGRSMNIGQWSRLKQSHAPIFSLFTFFGDRQ